MKDEKREMIKFSRDSKERNIDRTIDSSAPSICVKCTTIKFHSFFLARRFIQTISFLSTSKASKEIIQEIGEKSREEQDRSIVQDFMEIVFFGKCKKSLDLKENTFVSSKFKGKYLIISFELFCEERLDRSIL